MHAQVQYSAGNMNEFSRRNTAGLTQTQAESQE